MNTSSSAAPPSGPQLSVECALGSPSVITVRGEADLDGIGHIQEAVDRALAHHPHVVFDLAGVSFADSTFLTVLLQTRLSALERGGSVQLRAPSTSVRHLLEITGALVLFPTVAAEHLRQL
ncbi:STAS domain-containing protein [Actinacidiphila paucisporea]|uniref:Anti-anti-sigma factor n=1 Tax=Actinacidiphila paucisporea TaxID=310782 RepID=A0A1M7P7V6_9ACTN|nr:STAS domain-containing protein [Actinacidiphila paucisporea]SHN12769.1 anti-anti-sigma factor [Actinacidiphila paucisporea]